jgi:carbonic anhydrase
MLAQATDRITEVHIDDIGEVHLRDTISELLAQSEIVGEAIANGTLGIVGATYNLREGRVTPSIVFGDID